ncbi:MAG: imidazole glycerol phosphate synthase subunit HisH [Anaerovoracaceae bacterium]
MIGIIDYDAGNVNSVMKACEKLGGKTVLSSDISVLDECSSLILPGVGSFGSAVKNLKSAKLDDYIKSAVDSGKNFLGICLGMQMLFDKSFENGEQDGLALLHGDVVKFGSTDDAAWNKEFKIPHMGWNKLISNRDNDSICTDIGEGEYAYFVHSYYVRPDNWDDVVYYADYGVRVPGVVRRGNIFGMQFHPEKSSHTGLQLLKNFLKEGERLAD